MELFSYTIEHEMPSNIDFDALQNALQVEWPSILYTKYRWGEHKLDIVCTAPVESEDELTTRMESLSLTCLIPLNLQEGNQAPQTVEQAWTALRKERTSRLQLCDWTQLPDNSLNDTEKLIWKMYRQYLRDLPESTQDPFNPQWPTTPQPI